MTGVLIKLTARKPIEAGANITVGISSSIWPGAREINNEISELNIKLSIGSHTLIIPYEEWKALVNVVERRALEFLR